MQLPIDGPAADRRSSCRSTVQLPIDGLSVEGIGYGDETLDIGNDTASPVTDDYPGPGENRFTGSINWVQFDLEDDDVSGLEDPEQVYHRILARQ